MFLVVLLNKSPFKPGDTSIANGEIHVGALVLCWYGSVSLIRFNFFLNPQFFVLWVSL